jgi:hypothetical protein
MDHHDKPKTFEEIKMARIQERNRIRVMKATNRREEWVNMVANDPDFIQGKTLYFHTLYLI